MPPSVASGAAIMKLKGDEHILLAISVGHVTRTSILQFAGVLSPDRNLNSYTGPQYAEKKKLWQIDEQGVYSLTQDGNDALHYLLEANPCIGEDAERCSQKAIEEGAVAAAPAASPTPVTPAPPAPPAPNEARGGSGRERSPAVGDAVYVLPPLRKPLTNLVHLKKCISNGTRSNAQVYHDGTEKADVIYRSDWGEGLRLNIGSICIDIPVDMSGNCSDLPRKLEVAIRRTCFKFKAVRVAAAEGDSFSVGQTCARGTAEIPRGYKFKLADENVLWSFEKPLTSTPKEVVNVDTDVSEGGEGEDEGEGDGAAPVVAAATDPPAGKPSVGDEPTVDAWPTPTADGAPRSGDALPAATASRALELRSRKRSIPGGGSSALVPGPIGVAAMDKRLDEALSAIDACAEMRAWFGREHAKLGASSAASVETTFKLASRYAEQKASIERQCEAKREAIKEARVNLHAVNAAAEESMEKVRLSYPTLLASASPPSIPIGAQIVNAIAFIDAKAILKEWFEAEHEKVKARGVGELMELAERYSEKKAAVQTDVHSTLAMLRFARDELQNAYDACDEAMEEDEPNGGGSSPSKRAKGSRG
jgi:hypothetical protein